MKRWFLIPTVVVMLSVILVGGCAGGGVAPEDFARLEAQVAKLSTISAYNIWYDQYYEVNNFVFEDSAIFRAEFGALVIASGDAASQAAWDSYVPTSEALDAVVAALPEDATTWSEGQYNQWLDAYNNSYTAFGEVGTALYNATNYSASQVRILELEAQVAELSAISAYAIWYDQYYEVYNYAFADVATFNWKLGTLVDATNNTSALTAWYSYLEVDTALNDIVAELPEDYDTWTEEQYNQWLDASTARYDALGEVGTALFNAIAGY